MKRFLTISLVTFAMLSAPAMAADVKLPGFKKQPTPEAVVSEHLDALMKCDFDRIMQQYPEDAEFMLPNGVWLKGRTNVATLFIGFCKDRKDGGLKGAKFINEEVNVVGDTVNVSWRLEADCLAEPYRGADAYVTKDGMMQAQVTTFDTAQMKFKK
jgi:ketosteroid isomerase-like protein